MSTMSKLLPAFEELIDKTTEHWIWTGKRNAYGYGYYGSHGPAHRVSYSRYVAPIPQGMIVRHRCDIPACVRPDCLELGTPADNSRDMKERGRQARGERHSQVKLTEATVRAIRRMLGYGFRQSAIARLVGVDQSTISDIKRGKSWGWFS